MAAIPTRFCDLVMKGGITSGIVYPKAVCELAQHFVFRNIGGTSAGAIAAAATAAAELGRSRGKESFNRLSELPNELSGRAAKGKGSFLFNLFQPQPQFVRLFGVLSALLGEPKGKGRRVLFSLARFYPLPFGLGVLLAALTAAAVWGAPQAELALLRLAAGILLALLIPALSLLLWIYRDAKKLGGSHLGFCTGMPNGKTKGPALTPWLSELLNSYSGQPAGKPLTFGDLWQLDDPANTERERKIELQMMTTCLSHGRPYRLPLEQHTFYFNADEFRAFFPNEVVDWMVAHSREGATQHAGLFALPEEADFPVIVATRMSLSFPLLFAAVPLYAIDFNREPTPSPERCWFSDGGICSNFPVHFFDSPLPRWPTLALNLLSWDPLRSSKEDIGVKVISPELEGEANEQELAEIVEAGATDRKDVSADPMVYMPKTNGGALLETWNRFDLDSRQELKPGMGPVLGMLGAIMNSMQNWVDNRQVKVPGYRDRIANIILKEDEGGMNLNMPSEVIEDVAKRGATAGKMLAERFAPSSTNKMNWDNHRWVRFRSTMCALEEMLQKLSRGYLDEEMAKPLRTYRELLDRPGGEKPTSYPVTLAQRGQAQKALDALVALRQSWDLHGSLCHKSPEPEPELRIMPRFGMKR